MSKDGKKLTAAQIAMLEMLALGFYVGADHIWGPNWKADCEHLPHPKITTIAILERAGFIAPYPHEEGDEYRSYHITESGQKALEVSRGTK